MRSKKGYAYFIELALAIIIVFIILSGFVESEQTVFDYKKNEDLRQNSWYIIKNLDTFGAADIADFSSTDTYVKNSLNEFTGYDLELYNYTGCYAITDGTLIDVNYSRCPTINATIRNNIVSSFYTVTQNSNISSIRLYLWRKI